KWVEVGQLARTKPTANRPATLYRAAESTVTLHGNEYRAVVVHSSAHDKRRQKKIDRELAREKTSLEKSFTYSLAGCAFFIVMKRLRI
ncbi:MAG: hypothetical protein MUF52_14300, partial [Syntrophobacteraceae bacterium]|nr:hypothetical protein [Syntrophobacteraceae bacterium]